MPYKTYTEGSTTRTSRRTSARGGAKEEVKEEEEVPSKDTEMKDVTNTEYTEELKEEDEENNGETEKKKPWLQRTKEGGVKKIPKEVQKRRRNYRLKKMLTPKAPIMVLHELLGQSSVQYEMSEPAPAPMRNMPILYTAKTQYDNQTFAGVGPSKSIAKNICAEQVLQHIVTKSAATNGEGEGEEDEEMEGDQENNEKTKQSNNETSTPWVSLASLALFKLFNDWQAQGYVVPAGMLRGSIAVPGPAAGQGPAPQEPSHVWEPRGPQAQMGQMGMPMGFNGEAPAPKPPKQKKPKGEKEPKGEKTLPDNPQDKHPVQLLNEMAGPLVYEQTGQTGVPPNCIFTMAVTVNSTTYSGQGKSKKEAKKAAAISAVSEIYNVQYSS